MGGLTLRQTNIKNRKQLPLFIIPLFGDGAGLHPRYRHSIDIVRTPGWRKLYRIKYEDSVDGMEKSSDENDNTMSLADTSDEDATEESAGDSFIPPSRYHSRGLGEETSSHIITPSRNKTSSTLEEDSLRHSDSPNYSPRLMTTQHDDIERLIARPAKEKAFRMIRGYLDGWMNENLNEETLQTGIRNSLSDVLLNRQMQTTLIQSGISARQAQQRNTNIHKRKAHELDD